MNVLLMFQDRDFDPRHELLNPVMYRYPNAERRQLLTPHETALIQDLELETLLRAMAADDEFLFNVARMALLSGLRNDVQTILYRQEILKDALQNSEAIHELYYLTVEAVESSRKHGWGISSHYASSLLYSARELLQTLVGMLRKLRDVAQAHASGFKSGGFKTLFAMLANELSDEYLSIVQNHLAISQFRKGILLSSELGGSNESANLVLRKAFVTKESWLDRILKKAPPAYTFQLAERDEAGAQILGEMRQRGISRVALALGESAEHVLSFFKILRTELAFYLGCINLHARLSAKQEPLCFPVPRPAGERTHNFTGLYNVCLSLRTKGAVVGNTTNANGKGLTIVTGANQGGKSNFLRSIGVAQMMMQCGMFVGAEAFVGELCSGLFTHYKREEDVTMTSGKFDEELARMSDIADNVAPNAILLFNESFAATNEREGSEIAKQIASALLEKGIKSFYVTHLYDFARGFFERHLGDVLFLRAERQPDGKRTFRVIEGEPLESSYGKDLYHEIFDSEAEFQR